MRRLLSLALALAGLLGAACAAEPAPPADKKIERKIDMSTLKEPLVIGPTVGDYTYTNAPKLARLGPHRFMIPANYFTDQIGPDFQGSVSMELVWPKLEPLPPGRRREMSMNEFRRQIRAGFTYIDRRPLQEAMDSDGRSFSDDPILRQDPTDNISHRTRGEDVLGLERWYVSEADKARYLKLIEGQRDRYAWPVNPWDIEDWFVRRDAQGHNLTFIRCDPPSKPDGLIIQGDDVVKDENPRVAQCSHSFAIPEYGLSVEVDYPRVLMRDWARIEARYRELMAKFHIGIDTKGEQ
ncbi:hypothetical protein EBB59_02345 [Lysobacter pythonis]|uniref:Uncharacterized protein n=1 Tax=Solilutibacter pythonis TaxID=2483112 RepID=A0A3M2HXS8_9GAMM|nr:hypothetical protein [Lysobacter pythonis]RMH94531.1 hypothetical protein EBB59_02345 [Lysobacter pythonis]